MPTNAEARRILTREAFRFTSVAANIGCYSESVSIRSARPKSSSVRPPLL